MQYDSEEGTGYQTIKTIGCMREVESHCAHNQLFSSKTVSSHRHLISLLTAIFRLDDLCFANFCDALSVYYKHQFRAISRVNHSLLICATAQSHIAMPCFPTMSQSLSRYLCFSLTRQLIQSTKTKQLVLIIIKVKMETYIVVEASE